MSEQFTAIRIACEGNAQVIDLHDAPRRGSFGPTLSGLYHAIGCDLVEPLDLSDSLTMWLDEEGRITDQPINAVASHLAAAAVGLTYAQHGVVILTGGCVNGENLPLTGDQLAVLAVHLRVLGVPLAH